MFQNTALPSWEYPEFPIYSYTEQQPPYIPNIQVNPNLITFLPLISALTANVAGQQATGSPVRMYCYNNLAANGWGNQSFATVIKLVCDLYIVRIQQGMIYQNDIAALESLICEVLAAYGSALAYNNPQVMNVLHPDQKAAVISNFQLYSAMTQGGAGMQQQQRHVPGLALGTNQGRVGMSGSVPAHPVAAQMMGMSNQQPQQVVTGNKFAHAASPRVTEVQGSRLSGNAGGYNSPIKTAVQEVTQQAAPVPEPPKPQPVTVEGENDMDRNDHRAAYHDYLYPGQPPIREAATNPSSKIHTLVTDPDTLSPSNVSDFDRMHTSSFEAALMGIMADYIETVSDKTCIVPTVVELVNPIIAPIHIESFFEKFVDIHTFTLLARAVRSFAVNAKDIELQNTRTSMITWVSQFDRHMTALVNGWLSGALPGKITIDSFIEDGDELANYISKNFDSTALQAFNQFQTRTIRSIHVGIKPSTEENAVSITACMTPYLNQEMDPVEAKKYVAPLKFCYGVFHLNMLAEALNYKVPDTFTVVDKTKTPYLHQLLELTWSNVNFHNTIKNFIMTLDGTLFEFQRSGLDSTVFHIRTV